MTPDEAHRDIIGITSELIKQGFSEFQNFPSIIRDGALTKVQYSGFQDISIALRNVHYREIYSQMDDSRQYNIKMLDGGLIQLLYSFENQLVVKHRLSYYPSPSFEPFQNEPELYIDESNIYADILSRSVLPVPVRFDYAPEDAEAVNHPSSHLTLGEYKNCRIPVVSPICPSTFINFILTSFYKNASLELPELFETRILDRTLDLAEQTTLHLSIENQ